MIRICDITSCGRKHMAKGLCDYHYKRKTRHGDPLEPVRAPKGRTPGFEPYSLEERFWSKVDKNGAKGCWLWVGAKTRDGYGSLPTRGRHSRAHRIGWEIVFGPDNIPPIIDHSCRVRLCVNPEHLRPATSQQNSENRGTGSEGTSGYRNVYWDARNHKWFVSLTSSGMKHYGGRYKVFELHIAAYRARLLRSKHFTYCVEG